MKNGWGGQVGRTNREPDRDKGKDKDLRDTGKDLTKAQVKTVGMGTGNQGR